MSGLVGADAVDLTDTLVLAVGIAGTDPSESFEWIDFELEVANAVKAGRADVERLAGGT